MFKEFKNISTSIYSKKGSSKSLALGISFTFFFETYCILNAQFTNGSNPKERNKDFKEVYDEMEFGKGYKIADFE